MPIYRGNVGGARFTRAVILGSLLILGTAAAGCAGKPPARRSERELTTAEKVRLAQSLLEAGRLNDALARLREALVDEPDNGRLHGLFGKVNFLAGRFVEAESAFLRALELDPYLTDAHNDLGALYDATGREAEAEREYRLALADRAYPTPELVHLNLGLLYSAQGRNEEALAEFRQAVALNPKYFKGHFELASMLDRLGRLEEAAREYEVARPAYRNDPDFHYRLGFVYFRLGQREQARASLMRVLSVSPGSPSAARAESLLQLLD